MFEKSNNVIFEVFIKTFENFTGKNSVTLKPVVTRVVDECLGGCVELLLRTTPDKRLIEQRGAPAMAQRYAHLSPERKKKTVNLLDGLTASPDSMSILGQTGSFGESSKVAITTQVLDMIGGP